MLSFAFAPELTTCRMADETPWLGLVGHLAQKDMLLRALSKDRLHHALLVSGPAGVGKRSLARALAAARLCEVAPMQGCGTCPSCSRVLSGSHSDFVLVGPSGAANKISRADVQAQVLDLQQAPHEGRYHLTAFAPADRMSVEAANALLKTLEEPRPGVMILLITERPHAVLPTLKSRSLHLPLAPLSRTQTQQVLATMDPEGDPSALEPFMELCPGQPGRIMALAKDQNLHVARACVDCMSRIVEANAAAEIFASPQSALWKAWEELVQASQEEPAPSSEDPVERVTSSRKTKKKAGKKKASRKTSASASKKKPSAAAQRKALRSVCEVWLSQLRAQLRQAQGQNPGSRHLLWTRAQALLELSADIDRNINPRLLLERTLLAMLAAPSSGPSPSPRARLG